MFDDNLRAILPAYTNSLVKVLAGWKIKPNQVSVLGFVFAMSAAYLIAVGLPWYGIFMWLLSRLTDGIDGILARKTNQKTDFGGYLDILFDMASYSVMVLGFANAYPQYGLTWNMILFVHVLASTSTLALSSILEKRNNRILGNNRSIQFTPGLAEGGEVTLAYISFALLPTYIPVVSSIWLLMALFTIVQRSILANKLLREPINNSYK